MNMNRNQSYEIDDNILRQLREIIGIVVFIIMFMFMLAACSNADKENTMRETDCQHNVVIDNAKEATCTQSGLTEGKHCSKCGAVLVSQNIVPALGHTTTAGVCDRCGKSIGIWETKYYVDEFNDPTSQKYVTTKSLINGTFSNTATTNSNLNVKILVDSTGVSFMLYEYGNHQVKSGINRGYHIYIKYGNEKTRVSGSLTTDRISVLLDDNDVNNALKSGKTVSFYIEDTDYHTSTYSFSVESSNFQAEYYAAFPWKNPSSSNTTDTQPVSEAPETTEPAHDESYYYEIGMQAFSEKNYDDAREAFLQIDNPDEEVTEFLCICRYAQLVNYLNGWRNIKYSKLIDYLDEYNSFEDTVSYAELTGLTLDGEGKDIVAINDTALRYVGTYYPPENSDYPDCYIVVIRTVDYVNGGLVLQAEKSGKSPRGSGGLSTRESIQIDKLKSWAYFFEDENRLFFMNGYSSTDRYTIGELYIKGQNEG